MVVVVSGCSGGSGVVCCNINSNFNVNCYQCTSGQ